MSKKLTQDYVKKLFDCRDGVLYWKVAKGNRIKVGDSAGCLNPRGYLITRIDSKNYYNHRLIWLFEKGYIPEHGLDHKKRIKTDNRISELREISTQCNARNRGNPITNTSGVKGVCWDKIKNKWKAFIMVNNKYCNIGNYVVFIDAVCARLAAEQCLSWSMCDLSSPAHQYVKKHIKGIKH